MAELDLSGQTESFLWVIRGLSNPFNTAYYHSVGMSTGVVTSGTTTAPNGVLVSVTATSAGTVNYVGIFSYSPYPAGTHTIYGWARSTASDSYRYYPAGSATVTVTSATVARPANWNWTNSFVSGQNINITATEWNNFCSRINEFRRYRGYGNYSFTVVSRNQDMRASVANEARAAIQGISGYGAYIPYIYSGNNISVSYFNTLRSELNSII